MIIQSAVKAPPPWSVATICRDGSVSANADRVRDRRTASPIGPMIVQKLREHPIGVGGEVVTRHQKYAMPIPDIGRPCGRVELYSASFAKAG